MSAGETKVITKKISQRYSRLDQSLIAFFVDRNLDGTFCHQYKFSKNDLTTKCFMTLRSPTENENQIYATACYRFGMLSPLSNLPPRRGGRLQSAPPLD